MTAKSDHPSVRPCHCGGVNPSCPQCGGRGIIDVTSFRSIMAGPAPIRRRPVSPRRAEGASQGPPEPVRCPHCGFEVLNLAAHVAESHPDQPQGETEAEREAREREEARLAAVAEEIARREAEAAQRKAEARAWRQAVEGPQTLSARLERPRGVPPSPLTAVEPSGEAAAQTGAAPPPPAAPGHHPPLPAATAESRREPAFPQSHPPSPDTWERLLRAMADRSILTGTVRSRKPFGVFVDLGGVDGLVRTREMRAEDIRRGSPTLRDGQIVTVVVIGMHEAGHRVELSMRRAAQPRPSSEPTRAVTPAPSPLEGPMALAFRLAREKKEQKD